MPEFGAGEKSALVQAYLLQFEGSRAISKPAPNPGTHQLRLNFPKLIARMNCPEIRCDTLCGRLIFIHLQCWEVLPFLTIQRKRCIKITCP